jgi:hypothetical protein
MEAIEEEAYQEGIHVNDGQEIKEATGSDSAKLQKDLITTTSRSRT